MLYFLQIDVDGFHSIGSYDIQLYISTFSGICLISFWTRLPKIYDPHACTWTMTDEKNNIPGRTIQRM
jgi:hypothetical protein